MPIPGVLVETLVNPSRYSRAQIEQACRIAGVLQRGKLVLCAPPKLDEIGD